MGVEEKGQIRKERLEEEKYNLTTDIKEVFSDFPLRTSSGFILLLYCNRMERTD